MSRLSGWDGYDLGDKLQAKAHAEYMDDPNVGIMKRQTDMVNHPPHYTSGPKCECGKIIECIQVIEDKTLCVGNAIKYLWRAGLKTDAVMTGKYKEIEDLKKAAWYINREIERLSRAKDY